MAFCQRPGRRLLQLFPTLQRAAEERAAASLLRSEEQLSSSCRRLSGQTKQAEPATSAVSAEQPKPQTGPTAAPQRPARLSDVPGIARVLGLGGVLPFIALSPPIAGALPFMPADLVANAGLLQLGYGASIASFLGGIHWSLAMVHYPGTRAAFQAASDRYIWSVTPCLLAWPAVTLPSGPGSFVLATVLGAVYFMDRGFASRGLLPAWYMALRLPLTVGAVAGLLTSVVGFSVAMQDKSLDQPVSEKLDYSK